MLLDVIIAFSEVVWLEKKLKDHDRNTTHMDSWIDMLVLMVIFVGIIIAGILKITGKDTEDILIAMYGILLLSIGLEAALNSFISIYVKMRRWYHVDNITIKTKTETHVYDNIFNYKKNRTCYDFVYKGKDGLERIVVPIDEIMCVKHDIDVTTSYLDYLNKAKKPCKSV